MKVNLNNKTLQVVSHQGRASDIDLKTVFRFEQSEGVISADYAGGKVKLGKLIGVVGNGEIAFSYVHISTNGKMFRGESKNELRVSEDGKLLMHSRWQHIGSRGAGTYSLEEV